LRQNNMAEFVTDSINHWLLRVSRYEATSLYASVKDDYKTTPENQEVEVKLLPVR
jgi:hypothetical protein